MLVVTPVLERLGKLARGDTGDGLAVPTGAALLRGDTYVGLTVPTRAALRWDTPPLVTVDADLPTLKKYTSSAHDMLLPPH